ncbi:glutamate receptor ionotropic, delta-1-like [Procambarus clarkii]|uniref:glutamate receptor ionotropic, delta-1-like n=1 Tax=Procambarus clarkii TaxID=6728 RepID=UPI0037424CE2
MGRVYVGEDEEGVCKGFNEVVPVTVGGSLTLQGDLGSFLDNIRKNLDFNLTFRYVQGFGFKTANGSFNGAIGVLERREADFGSASLSVLEERAEVLDFSEWFGIHNTRFITKVPTHKDDQFLLFQIYTWQTWCVIGGFLALMSTMLMATWREADQTPRPSLAPVTTTLKAAVYMASGEQPRSSGGRVVLVSTWLVVMVLVAVYQGNLTAFLSIPRVVRPPETITELIQKGYTLSISLGFSQYAKMKVQRHDVY